MKKMMLGMLVMVGLVLVGCQSGDAGNSKNKKATEVTVEETTEQTTTQATTAKVSETKEKVSETVESTSEDIETTPWDQEKAQSLQGFMRSWGTTMEQDYREYSPTSNVDLYGLSLPESVLGGGSDWQAAVNEQPISIAWSEDGLGADYELVAVYSDAESQPYLGKHVYFFTIVAGVPKVLVTSQNQGNENNYLHFKESENAQLNDGFAEIVAN